MKLKNAIPDERVAQFSQPQPTQDEIRQKNQEEVQSNYDKRASRENAQQLIKRLCVWYYTKGHQYEAEKIYDDMEKRPSNAYGTIPYTEITQKWNEAEAITNRRRAAYQHPKFPFSSFSHLQECHDFVDSNQWDRYSESKSTIKDKRKSLKSPISTKSSSASAISETDNQMISTTDQTMPSADQTVNQPSSSSSGDTTSTNQPEIKTAIPRPAATKKYLQGT